MKVVATGNVHQFIHNALMGYNWQGEKVVNVEMAKNILDIQGISVYFEFPAKIRKSPTIRGMFFNMLKEVKDAQQAREFLEKWLNSANQSDLIWFKRCIEQSSAISQLSKTQEIMYCVFDAIGKVCADNGHNSGVLVWGLNILWELNEMFLRKGLEQVSFQYVLDSHPELKGLQYLCSAEGLERFELTLEGWNDIEDIPQVLAIHSLMGVSIHGFLVGAIKKWLGSSVKQKLTPQKVVQNMVAKQFKPTRAENGVVQKLISIPKQALRAALVDVFANKVSLDTEEMVQAVVEAVVNQFKEFMENCPQEWDGSVSDFDVELICGMYCVMQLVKPELWQTHWQDMLQQLKEVASGTEYYEAYKDVLWFLPDEVLFNDEDLGKALLESMNGNAITISSFQAWLAQFHEFGRPTQDAIFQFLIKSYSKDYWPVSMVKAVHPWVTIGNSYTKIAALPHVRCLAPGLYSKVMSLTEKWNLDCDRDITKLKLALLDVSFCKFGTHSSADGFVKDGIHEGCILGKMMFGAKFFQYVANPQVPMYQKVYVVGTMNKALYMDATLEDTWNVVMAKALAIGGWYDCCKHVAVPMQWHIYSLLYKNKHAEITLDDLAEEPDTVLWDAAATTAPFSPFQGFSVGTYLKLAALVQESSGLLDYSSASACLRLAVLFGKEVQGALDFVKNINQIYGVVYETFAQAVHEAGLHVPPINRIPKSVKNILPFIKKYPQAVGHLELLETLYSKGDMPADYQEFKLKRLVWGYGLLDTPAKKEAAAICSAIGAEQSVFVALSQFDKSPKSHAMLPDISFETEEGVKVRLLGIGDKRALIIGEESGCCQKLSGYGEDAAIQSYTEPETGVYVFESENGTLLAQTWAWLSSKKDVVLDSIESSFSNEGTVQKVAKAVALLSAKLAEHKLKTAVGSTSYGMTSQVLQYMHAQEYAKVSKAVGTPRCIIPLLYSDADAGVLYVTSNIG